MIESNTIYCSRGKLYLSAKSFSSQFHTNSYIFKVSVIMYANITLGTVDRRVGGIWVRSVVSSKVELRFGQGLISSRVSHIHFARCIRKPDKIVVEDICS